MFVRDWMTAPAVVVAPGESVETADTVMDLHKVRRLAVVERGRLVGIVTRSDVQAAMKGRKVGDVMAKSPYTVAPDETLEGAAKVMALNKVSGLPVTEDGHVKGMITESDIFRALVEIMGFGEVGARVAMTVPDSEDVIGAIARKVEGRRMTSLVTHHNATAGRWEVMIRLSGRDPAERKAAARMR